MTLRSIYERIRDAVNSRPIENAAALAMLRGCDSVLDVGCGTGNFLEVAPMRVVGVDMNYESVAICRVKGLTVLRGDALRLPFPDDAFDGAYCAHLLHVFDGQTAVALFGELVRVVRPSGRILINTIPDNPRSWIHGENARPWPPPAIRGLFARASTTTETSPTFTDLPGDVRQVGIWFRRPALFERLGHRSHAWSAAFSLMNGIQYRAYLRKYWTFNGYIIALRNSEKRGRPRPDDRAVASS